MSSADFDEQLNPARDAVVGDRAIAAWEIASVASSVLIAEWILAAAVDRSRLIVAVPITLAFILMISSHRVRGETLRDLGFRFDNFLRAAWFVLLPMAVITAACLVIGWSFGAQIDFMRWHGERPIAGQLALGFGWGFVQQYVLQSFMNRRAKIILGSGWLSILLVAAVFAGLHLPNPWLTLVTFLGGLVWATVYQRAPNIFALAISHSLMTWVLVSTLPASAINHLRIGFKYFA